MHLGRRIERAAALLVVNMAAVKGIKADMADYMPHEDDGIASVDDVILFMGARKRE